MKGLSRSQVVDQASWLSFARAVCSNLHHLLLITSKQTTLHNTVVTIHMEPAYKKVKSYLIAMDEKYLLGRGRLG